MKEKPQEYADTEDRSGKGPVQTVTAADVDVNMLAVVAKGLRDILRYHQLMGIETYPLSPALRQLHDPGKQSRRGTDKGIGTPDRVKIPPVVPSGPEKSEVDTRLHLLQKELEACRLCSLSGSRQGIVPGRGQAGASLCVVGDYSLQEGSFSEATLFSADEDIMLWNMMKAIGLTSGAVYVTNVLKCCPNTSVQPSEQNLLLCRQHLFQEIAMVQPKVLCAMGEQAAHALIDTKASLFGLRGRLHSYRNDRSIQVMVTLHPRLLLKNASLKKAAWQDLQMVSRLLQTM